MKNYETYSDSLISPHNPNGDGYTEESESEETDYDNPYLESEEEQEFKKHRKDLTTEFFKLIETSFKP